jgi:hypothetical protein
LNIKAELFPIASVTKAGDSGHKMRFFDDCRKGHPFAAPGTRKRTGRFAWKRPVKMQADLEMESGPLELPDWFDPRIEAITSGT